MKNTTPTQKCSPLAVKTGIKGGRLAANHSRALQVRSGLKGGRIATNHNRALR
jgi:hypothetical protein